MCFEEPLLSQDHLLENQIQNIFFLIIDSNFTLQKPINRNGKGNLSIFEMQLIEFKSNIKHLMTGPKGNSEFCFPETLNVPRGEAEGNIEVEGKQNSLFPEGPVIKCFVIPPNSK